MVRKTANFGFGASQRVLHIKAALFEPASIQPRMDLPKFGAAY
jgi:hypothetical protein